MITSERFKRGSRTDGGAFRWQQVAELEEKGLTRREIAERLGLDPRAVEAASTTAAAHKMREEPWATTRERKVKMMAAIYPDRARQRWIYLQMGLEYPE